MSNTPTCAELFSQLATWALNRYEDSVLERHAGMALYAAGHIAGEAEKVYLGACQAMMIRAGEDWQGLSCDIARKVAEVYGLEWETLMYDGGVLEQWLFRTGDRNASRDFWHLQRMSTEYPATWDTGQWALWHEIRARLCGIPPEMVDLSYHSRAGYNARCEPMAPAEKEDAHG